MKSILFFFACLFFMGASAQTNTGILQIQIYPSQLSGTCTLAGVDTVYMHSGLGWSNPDSIWQSIVGDWGLNDGKGMMTHTGVDTYSICFNVVDYYTTLADADSLHGGEGYGPMPQGATPYNIGVVFRTASCPISNVTHKPECTADKTGKDITCNNIYILGINDPQTMSVQDNSGNPFAAVTATYITGCAGVPSGIQNLGTGISDLLAYPMPFTEVVNLQFDLNSTSSPKAEIYDLLGQKVADLSSTMHNGQNLLTWRGTDLKGKPVAAGMYTYKLSNNNLSFSGKIVKQ